MVTSVNSIFTLQGHGVHLGILVRVEGGGKKKCAYPYSSWILDITGFKIFNWSTTDNAGWFLVSNREYCNQIFKMLMFLLSSPALLQAQWQ